MISPARANAPRPRRGGPTRPQLAGILVLVLALVFTTAFAATLILAGGPDATASPSGIAYSSGSPTPGPTSTDMPTVEPSPSPSASPTPTPQGTATPTVAPTATATSTSTSTSTATPTSPPTIRPTAPPTNPGGPPATYVSNGSRSSKKVALTFDFGGRVGDAKAIVNYLVAHNIHATIFITGSQIDTTVEGPQVLATICPRTAQFALGNHSYSHPNFSGLTVAQMQSQLSTTEAAFAKYCDRSPRPYFRPPSGDLGKWGTAKYQEIMTTLGAAGYSRAIMWDCDTKDWDEQTTKQQIIDTVHAKAQSGSIVLMHLGGFNTLAALPSVIADVQAKGLTPVTLTELGI